jgi:rhomboid family GlyGly-CTERM serine protease
MKTPPTPTPTLAAVSPRFALRDLGLTPSVLALCALIALANTHLLGGALGPSLIFMPDAVVTGEWYRLLSFPFVHVTWYHLLLDAGAFLLLYKEIEDTRLRDRITYLTLCGGLSLAAAWIASPLIDEVGLCGLSGIAHGLMAIAALRMMQRGDERKMGLAMFVVVVLKAMYEALTGTVMFEFLHFGLCGSPVAVSHAGGVLGGILGFYLLTNSTNHKIGTSKRTA